MCKVLIKVLKPLLYMTVGPNPAVVLDYPGFRWDMHVRIAGDHWCCDSHGPITIKSCYQQNISGV